MKNIKYFADFSKEFLTEQKKDKNKKYSYGCLMLYYDFPDIKEIHDEIDEDDIYSEDGMGLETETHTTLLYGFHDDEIEDDKEILDLVLDKDIPLLKLYNISIFENEKYDVLKFDVKHYMVDEEGEEDYSKKDDMLIEINKDLTKEFPYTTNFPDYHAHSTIGYLVSGKGKDYVKKFKDKEFIVTPKQLIYSKPDKTKVKKKITIKKEDKKGK